MNRDKLSDHSDLSTIRFSVLYSIYVVMLAAVYWFYVSILFSYEGFYRRFSPENIIPVVLVDIALLIVLPKKNQISAAVAIIALLLIAGPTTVLAVFGPVLMKTFYISSIALVVLFIVSSHAKVQLPNIGKVSINQTAAATLVLIVIYFSAVVASGGLKYINFNILEVYQYREAAEENLPEIFGYISSAIGAIFIPFLTVYGLASKKRSLLLTGIILGLFLFALTAHKSPLFYSVISSLIYRFYGDVRRFSSFITVGLIVALAFAAIDLSMALDTTIHGTGFEGLFGSLIVRRAILVPAQLNDAYVKFFSDNVKVFWSNSTITFGLFRYPYDQDVSHLVGRIIFGRSALGANTGFIGSGYAQAGVFGVMLYSSMIGIFLAALNSKMQALSDRFIVAVSFPILFVILLSSDLLTSLLTHGGLVLLFLLSVTEIKTLSVIEVPSSNPTVA